MVNTLKIGRLGAFLALFLLTFGGHLHQAVGQTEGSNLICDWDHVASPNPSPLEPAGNWCTCMGPQTVYHPVYKCDWVFLWGGPCAETLRSNGTVYGSSDLSPVRTWPGFASCIGGCVGLGTTCAVCAAAALAAGIPTGGTAAAVIAAACGSACAGTVGVCFNSAQNCCGMYCEIAGVGAPSTSQHYSCQ